MFDAMVIGGSYAGLSAALQLARARRSTLIVDEGNRRNRFADASHGFLGQDGRAPADIATDARAQLMSYPTVEWVDARAQGASSTPTGFAVGLADGTAYESRRVILATGVVDALPEIPGLSERWGKSVFHCPYCHGYELDNGPVGVLAVSPLSMHHALLLPEWGRTTFFTNGAFEPDAEQLTQLRQRGVRVENVPVAKVVGNADVMLNDGRVISLNGLFTMTHVSMASPLAEQLGCGFEQGPAGPFIQTDAFKETTVPGVFACGDAARGFGSVALAVGDGALAGVATHQSLVFRDT